MKTRTVETEKRRGIVLLAIGAFVLAAMFAMWWLVARTNSEGHHDAQLLPFLALIPILMGVYHLIRARFLHHA